jgi:hypothetical protein
VQALVELIAGLVALLAAAALAQFGVDLNGSKAPDREIQRVGDACGGRAPNTVLLSVRDDRDC